MTKDQEKDGQNPSHSTQFGKAPPHKNRIHVTTLHAEKTEQSQKLNREHE